MSFINLSAVFIIFGFISQNITTVHGKPADCGCSSVTIPNMIIALLPPTNKASGEQSSSSSTSQKQSSQSSSQFNLQPASFSFPLLYPGNIPNCGFGAYAASSPISFAPASQQAPITNPCSPTPSVTIPNIIAALLPPTNKASNNCC